MRTPSQPTRSGSPRDHISTGSQERNSTAPSPPRPNGPCKGEAKNGEGCDETTKTELPRNFTTDCSALVRIESQIDRRPASRTLFPVTTSSKRTPFDRLTAPQCRVRTIASQSDQEQSKRLSMETVCTRKNSSPHGMTTSWKDGLLWPFAKVRTTGMVQTGSEVAPPSPTEVSTRTRFVRPRPPTLDASTERSPSRPAWLQSGTEYSAIDLPWSAVL